MPIGYSDPDYLAAVSGAEPPAAIQTRAANAQAKADAAATFLSSHYQASVGDIAIGISPTTLCSLSFNTSAPNQKAIVSATVVLDGSGAGEGTDATFRVQYQGGTPSNVGNQSGNSYVASQRYVTAAIQFELVLPTAGVQAFLFQAASPIAGLVCHVNGASFQISLVDA